MSSLRHELSEAKVVRRVVKEGRKHVEDLMLDAKIELGILESMH